MLALDTNVLARYYVREADASRATLAQSEAARRVIEGGGDLFVAKTVLLELERVLRGVYGLPRKDNLRAGFDFADALHHASSRACAAFLSFDARRFARKARRMALTPPVRAPQ